MITIIILILLAMLFLVAELVLLPGVTISGILSLICGGVAIYLGFLNFGPTIGWILVATEIVLMLLTIILSLRSNTWQRLALKQEVGSSASEPIEEQVALGTRGRTLSRLSPMGTVEIEGKIYEAKLLSGYVDPQCEVEVIGYENSHILVKRIQ